MAWKMLQNIYVNTVSVLFIAFVSLDYSDYSRLPECYHNCPHKPSAETDAVDHIKLFTKREKIF